MIVRLLLAAILIAHALGALWLGVTLRMRYDSPFFTKMMSPWQIRCVRYGTAWVLLPLVEFVLLTVGGFW